jgi:ribonuclease Z
MNTTRNFMRISGGRLHTSDNHGTSQNSYVCDGVTIHALRFSTDLCAPGVSSHVCYVGQTEAQKGKFDLRKATELMIPKGPLYGKLKNGDAVTLADGTIVTPDQVLGPAEASRYFIIICNMELYEDKLVQDASRNEYFNRCDGLEEIQSHIKPDCTLFADFVMTRTFDSLWIACELYDCHILAQSHRLCRRIHLSPEKVVRSAVYQSWMHRFGSAVQHIFMSSSCKESSFVAATQTSRKLHCVSPSLFAEVQPYLATAGAGVASGSVLDGVSQAIVLATPSMEYRILPTKRRGLAQGTLVINGPPDHSADESWTTSVRKGDDSEDLQADWLRMQTAEDYVGSAEYAQLLQSQSTIVSNASLSDLGLLCAGSAALHASADNRLIFLGTGCAVPSKYRNVSGILLQLAATDSSMLLDVGEGTWGQLLRVGLSRPDVFGIPPSSFHNSSGQDSYDCDLQSVVSLRIAHQLKVVWVSHPHADHHLGLLTVIAERKKVIMKQNSLSFKPLVVVAPPSVLLFLEENALLDGYLVGAFLPLSTRQLDPHDPCDTADFYWPAETERTNTTSETGWSFKSRVVAESCRAMMASSLALAKGVFASMGLHNVLNVQVTHCRQSFGLVVSGGGEDETSPAAFKLVYSGDTRPCDLLIEHGRGATILIHEATFEDDKLHEAVTKRHSTLGEALDVGNAMGAHRVVLTHFSQRYPSMPQIDAASIQPDADLQQHYQRKVPLIGGANSCNFIVAFDFMHVSFRDLLWAPTVTAVLERVFPPVVVEADEVDDVELDEGEHKVSEIATKVKQQTWKKGGRDNKSKSLVDEVTSCTCCDRSVSDPSGQMAQLAMECNVHMFRGGKRKAEKHLLEPLL